MSITYPPQCDTNAKKLAYIYELQEQLRLMHNFMSKWKRDGLKTEEYNGLSAKLQTLFPRVGSEVDGKLTAEKRREFQVDVFDGKQAQVCNELVRLRGIIKNAATYEPDPMDITAIGS